MILKKVEIFEIKKVFPLTKDLDSISRVLETFRMSKKILVKTCSDANIY